MYVNIRKRWFRCVGGEFSEDEVLPCSRIGGDVEKPSADASSSSKRKVEEQGSRHEICRTVEDMN